MIGKHRVILLALLLFIVCSFRSIAQPTLPDIIGSDENGMVLLSWTCQYDGVKSIGVRRSADSTFNFSTIGYVKRLYKGVQGYIDGHPMPGKNYYKLSIVFNSGLTWTTNHVGVFVDSNHINRKRVLPSNDALQKLIVTESNEHPSSKDGAIKSRPVAPADRDKYMEVLKKEEVVQEAPRPKLKLEKKSEEDAFMESVPEDTRKRMVVTFSDDAEINPGNYLTENKKPEKKKISITFNDRDDVSAYMETLPKNPQRKITISYHDSDVNPGKYLVNSPKGKPADKKISMTFNDEKEVTAYMESLPKTAKSKITLSYNIDSLELARKKIVPDNKKVDEPPKQRLRINFTDDASSANPSTAIRSKYVNSDANSGHILLNFPDDYAGHNYSIRFFDKDNKAVIDVPKFNSNHIILDKRNFQRKGQYKFTIKKDALELESGYIQIY